MQWSGLTKEGKRDQGEGLSKNGLLLAVCVVTYEVSCGIASGLY